jgi:hypothetical protein
MAQTTKTRGIYTQYSCTRLVNTSAEFPVSLCETLWLKRNTIRAPLRRPNLALPGNILSFPGIPENFNDINHAPPIRRLPVPTSPVKTIKIVKNINNTDKTPGFFHLSTSPKRSMWQICLSHWELH